VAALRLVQPLAPLLHVLDGRVDELWGQAESCAAQACQVLLPGLLLVDWPAAFLCPHPGTDFGPDRVVQDVELGASLGQIERTYLSTLLGDSGHLGLEAAGIVVLQNLERPTTWIGLAQCCGHRSSVHLCGRFRVPALLVQVLP